MIISRTPYRISFLGGGTDYPAWFEQHGGEVLSATINKYCHISCRVLPPFFEHKSRIVWQKIERVHSNDEIEHPAVRAALQHLNITHGIEIHHDGDLPARSGLGSSSAFSVGLYHALFALQERMISRYDLAKEAIYTEKVLLKEEVGVQDQIATSFGGFNKIRINKDHSFIVSPVILPKERLERFQKSIMLFYTGVSRSASDIAKKKVQSFSQKSKNLHIMQEMVEEALKILGSSCDLSEFGKLLHEFWLLKRDISSTISSSFIDNIYERALGAGATGGKILGAGGGGFILFFVAPEKQASVLKALNELLYVPIEFEFSGSQIIFYRKDHYSKTALEESCYSSHVDNSFTMKKVMP